MPPFVAPMDTSAMLTVLHSTSTLFVTILLGFLAGFAGFFKRGQDLILINYVFYIALPLNLFLACFYAKWQVFNANYLIAYSLAMIIIIIATYFLSKKFLATPRKDTIVNTISVSQIDGAYFTVPLFILIFQSAAFAVPLMLLQNAVFFTIGLIFLQMSIEKDKRSNGYSGVVMQRIWRVLTHNPLISFSIIGLLLNFFKITLPDLLLHNAQFIGDTSSAVALFSLGLTCFFHIGGLKKMAIMMPLALLGTLKLLIFPLIALILAYALKLPHDLLIAVVLLTASPSATHTYIIANKYEVDAQIATFNVVFTTLLSFITINFWLYVL